MPGPSPPFSSSAGSSSALLPLGLLSHLLLLCSGSLLTSGFGLTLCMGDPDLAQTIAEVQGALERLRISVENRAARPSSPWVVVRNPSPTVKSSSSAEAPPLSGGGLPVPSPLRHCDIRDRFPPCPPHCLELCERLAPAGNFSAADRARRAWTAGLWAKEVFEGSVATPDPIPVLSLRPSVYIVVRSERLPGPARYSTFRALRAAVGPLENSDTICHSFPSLARSLYDQVASSPGCLGADATSALAFASQARCFLGGPASGLASGGGLAVSCRASLSLRSLSRGIGACCGRGRHWGRYSRQVVLLSSAGFCEPLRPVVGFEPSAPHVLPAPEELIRALLTRRPIGVQAKRAAKPKRVTTAKLAEQVNQLASVLPGLVEQACIGAADSSGGRALAAPCPGSSAGLDVAAWCRVTYGACPAERSSSSSSGASACSPKVLCLALLVGSVGNGHCPGSESSRVPPSLPGGGAGPNHGRAGLSSKGSAKRERLQQELMQRTGTFYLQVCQDAFRRLYPASAVPATLAELKADGRLSFVTYLKGTARAATLLW